MSGKFPGERIIGIGYGLTHSLNKDMSISNNFTYATLLHFTYSYSKLEKYLFKAIEMGITTPREVAELYSFEQSRIGVLYNKSSKYDSLKYFKNYVFFGTYNMNKDSINFYREKIGLSSLETDEKKAIFCKKNHFIGM